MRWLVLRALGLWIVSLTITSAVVLVVRSNPQPSTLDAIGLTLCQDDPCFRGLQVGSSWDEVQTRLPNSMHHNGRRELQLNIARIGDVLILRSDDGKTVLHIALSPDNEYEASPPAPIPVAEVVARYGTPCMLIVSSAATGPSMAILIYPQLKVFVDILIGNLYYRSRKFQLQMTSPVLGLLISQAGGDGQLTCDAPLDRHTGRWMGFISADLYLARFRSKRLASR